MKVLFLTNIPSPYRVDFFNELGKQCDLTVVYERTKAGDRDKKWKGTETENFKEIFLESRNVGNDKSICISIIKYLDKNKFDVFVVGGYSSPTAMIAIEYMRMNNIPFILSTDGGFVKKDKYIIKKIKTHYISAAKTWLSTGETTTKYLMNYGSKIENIYKYPFSSIHANDILVDIVSESEKSKLKSKLGMVEKKIIVSVGQFIYRKGFDVLLKACGDIDSDCGVYIIGGTPTKELLELRNELNLCNVHFIEFKTKEELKEYYKAANLFILPTREDIWGLVINEAMAYGLPVITTDRCIAGLELIDENKNGFIIPVDNHKILSEKVNYIINNDYIIENMSKYSLEKIKSYTIETMADRHYKVFQEYLRNRDEIN